MTHPIISLLDGPIEVALLCGDSEPADSNYSRCTVDFTDGSNTEECRYGPYEASFKSPITGFVLYRDGEEVARERVTPHTPVTAETSIFPAGSLRIQVG